MGGNVFRMAAAGCLFAARVFGDAFSTPRLTAGMEPRGISFPLAGAGAVTLEVDIGGDSYRADQAIWANARFILGDGSSRPLSRIRPMEASVGWGTLLTNGKNHVGKPLKIGKRIFNDGLWSHAPAFLVFPVPAGAVRFEADVGVDPDSGCGSVAFHVAAGDLRPLRALAAAYGRIDPDALRRLAGRRSREKCLELADLIRRAPARPSGEQMERALGLFREIMVRDNPAVDFDEILFIDRKTSGPDGLVHNWQSNSMAPKRGYDNALFRVNIREKGAKPVEVFRPGGGAFIGDVDLHWDAGRALFSSIGEKNRAWHVFELDLKTGKARQVSRDNEKDINHYDACYLPDGRIAFTCTALLYAVPCVNGGTPVANLFRMKADGTEMEALTSDQEHAWCPQVMADGRILYLRWEYTDIAHAVSRMLFTCNPDGTNQRAFYGSNSYWPNGIFYARPVPGSVSKFVGIVTGHHGLRRMGEATLFDASLGREEAGGAVQQLPGFGKTVKAVVRDQLANGSRPLSLHPYPLDGDNFLISRQAEAGGPWEIVLIDRFDNELVLQSRRGSYLFEPIPLRKEKMPPALPDRFRPGEKDATVYLADIYQGPGLRGIPRGTVKRLRVYTYTFSYPGFGALYGSLGVDGPWDMRRILGTVPVDGQGSACFKVPANTPVAVQPLDAEGKSLQIMRSWFTARPGENLSCLGCHEKIPEVRNPPRALDALKKTPAEIAPWRGPARGYTFEREVQPVLDRRCAGCHDGSPGRPDFRGGLRPEGQWDSRMDGRHWYKPMAGNFSRSYFELHRFIRHPGIESGIKLTPPMEFHADSSELITILRKGHHGVELDGEDWDRLVTWIDLNAPYHGYWREMIGQKGIELENRRIPRREKYLGIREDHNRDPLPPPRKTAFIPPKPPPPAAKDDPAPPGWPFDPGSKPRPGPAAFDLGEGVRLVFRFIPPGEFRMGSAAGFPDERPMTAQKIRAFWMLDREVDNALFRRFDPGHSSFQEDRHGYQFGVENYDMDGDSQPAVRMSWREAQAFCAWLSGKLGKPCRLPTEAEWEYAARAGSDNDFWWGDRRSDFAKFANLADFSLHYFSGNPYAAGTQWKQAAYRNPNSKADQWVPRIAEVDDGGFFTENPAGTWKANPWGLFDMHGNVAEWTLSRDLPYPYRADDGRNDPAPADSRRVVRGGSWYDRPRFATASYRYAYREYQPVHDVGFRVVFPAP